ncbi:hypothetical protein GYMLUDRAFT_71371 [Collybiopsis luxurians FD-317 M1]|uniref:Eukaryotic translation initiation factor 4E class II n=1 Tax=Collybiopsis luxurians FD-317 M1 TaxID=944289 RepID=A0A0D0C6W4_9AGAR|nr:hypothetical protein GYMLUDRAFT_71371 [Collybiopsis luxurians FD-317 M1]
MSTNSSSSSNRMPMPSLNQLAARMTIKPDGSKVAASDRPRLAASVLRTTSNASTSSLASSNDSTAVNPPGNSTRAASPSNTLGSISPPTRSTSSTPGPEGGETLTSEKLEKLNAATSSEATDAAITKDKGKPPVKGYKNIPSLDAITARLAKNRALSIDGTSKPPEPEMVEDPKTPGLHILKEEEHPLQFSWTMYHDAKSKSFPYTPAPNSANPAGAAPPLIPKDKETAAANSTSNSPTADQPFPHVPAESTDYEANLTVIGTFTTVEQFCRYFNWLKSPSMLDRSTNSNYHLFKSNIKPMWEDPANAKGGKWVITMRNQPQLLDQCWAWLAMALVGEELEEGGDEVCGAVVSLRSKVDRIQVWIRSRGEKEGEVERINAIGKRIVKILDIGEKDGIGLEFQYNTDERPPANRFITIQAMPQTGFGSRFQGLPAPNPAPANANANANAPTGHSHSRSIGGIGVSGTAGFTPVETTQPPLSAGGAAAGAGGPAGPNAGGAGAFGSFGVPLGTGSSGWRRRG